MIKTEKEIQGDLLTMVKSSPLASAVSGNVYRSDGISSYRPRDSHLEDIEVIITKAFAEQVQNGVATILVYVLDIDPYGNGVFVEDGERTAELARIAQDWIDEVPEAGSGYLLSQEDAISTIPIEEIQQHAVSIQLMYKFYE